MDADQKEALERVIILSSGGDEQAINQVIEAIGNDQQATQALVNFMDGIAVSDNPSLLQIQYNQQLTNSLFKTIANYIVRD
jgi:hypothetical protein